MGPRPRRLDVSARLPPSDTLPPETDPALRQFLLYLGSGLTAAGEAVNEIQVRIRLAYGAPGAVVPASPGFAEAGREPPAHALADLVHRRDLARASEVLNRWGATRATRSRI
jgi:hypothetical protein